MMGRTTSRSPAVVYESLDEAITLSKAGQLGAFVRKKLGEGPHGIGEAVQEARRFAKRRPKDSVLREGVGEAEVY